jgi:hypothetical protein
MLKTVESVTVAELLDARAARLRPAVRHGTGTAWAASRTFEAASEKYGE